MGGRTKSWKKVKEVEGRKDKTDGRKATETDGKIKRWKEGQGNGRKSKRWKEEQPDGSTKRWKDKDMEGQRCRRENKEMEGRA